jgi:hypothetical protein
MSETYCVRHFDQIATDHCATCNKPYCANCLGVDEGQPICANCKDVKAKAALAEALKTSGNPMAGGSPLNFKGKGMDDDPLGLFGGGGPTPSKVERPPVAPAVSVPLPTPVPLQPPSAPLIPSHPIPPKAAPPMPFFMPSPAPSSLDKLGTAPNPLSPIPLPTPAPMSVPLTSSAIAPPQAGPPSPSPLSNPVPFSLDKLGIAPNSLAPTLGSQPKSPVDLNSMMNHPQPPGLSFPKASAPTPTPAPSTVVPAAPISFPVDTGGLEAPKKKMRVFSLAKIWVKYLIRRSYEMFDPLAKKLKVPTYVFLGLVAALIIGAIIGIGSILNKPSVILADTIQPIHMVQMSSSQVSEMDITAYAEFQTQLQTMGFTPVIQMTIPQLPSPNFFDVSMKEDAGTYSEILKMPGQIAPHLSFVSVFSNGVWFSTNAWPGDSQTMDYLVSEYYPDDTPDQLYAQHTQTLEKLKQDKGWQVQTMGENRYMAALSDHLRWFMNKKDIQGYQADFKLWH